MFVPLILVGGLPGGIYGALCGGTSIGDTSRMPEAGSL
jgi:hypothetical protein